MHKLETWVNLKASHEENYIYHQGSHLTSKSERRFVIILLNYGEVFSQQHNFPLYSIQYVTSPWAQIKEKSGHFWKNTSPKSLSSESPDHWVLHHYNPTLWSIFRSVFVQTVKDSNMPTTRELMNMVIHNRSARFYTFLIIIIYNVFYTAFFFNYYLQFKFIETLWDLY